MRPALYCCLPVARHPGLLAGSAYLIFLHALRDSVVILAVVCVWLCAMNKCLLMPCDVVAKNDAHNRGMNVKEKKTLLTLPLCALGSLRAALLVAACFYRHFFLSFNFPPFRALLLCTSVAHFPPGFPCVWQR